VQRAGFELVASAPTEADAAVLVDTDFFSQIVINLVDNAVKFSSRAECKRIEIGWSLDTDARARFSVRDHGPGVPADQAGKIFRLFYRSESESTRETSGTGIGLALVEQLAAAMGASVEVHNREPGAEFSVLLPVVAPSGRLPRASGHAGCRRTT
jgi:signal transduction histidine kinase